MHLNFNLKPKQKTARAHMDIKQYIDYFDVMSHLDRDLQFNLLEQANNEIQADYKMPIFALIAFFVRLGSILIFVGGSYLIFGYSGWILALSLLIGLLCAKVAITEISDSILLRYLKRNLNQDS